MNRGKIVCILVSMLLCVTVSAVTGAENNEMLDIQNGVGNYGLSKPIQKVNDKISVINPGIPESLNRDDILTEGFEGVWETDPDGDPDYMVPVDPVYGKWDVDGNQHGHVSGYPGLTWYWSQFEDADHPTLDISPPVGTYWAGLWWGSGQDEWFITPDMDMSLNGDLQLEFLSAYTMMRYGASPTQHDYIQVSTDHGANWDIVADLSHDPEYDFDGCTGGPAGDPSWNWCEFPIIIDLSDYDGSDSLMIAWNYVYDGTPPGGVWLFDEVSLTGNILNEPPEIPGKPDGPDSGYIGNQYDFETSTTDPEGDDIYYWFEFGDGDNSGWLGPYGQGQTVSASHTWTLVGSFPVKVKAKDLIGGESDFSPSRTITISDPPVLEIGEIKGGLFKVTATIKNKGGSDATGVAWEINLNGGLILLGASSSGTIDIPKDGQVNIQSDFIFGIGRTQIGVTAEIPESSDGKSISAFVIGFYII